MEDESGADRKLRKIADGIASEGGKPFVIPLGADHPPTGALGYGEAAEELLSQAAAMSIEIDTLVLPSGSASTHAGLLAGLLALGSRIRILDICVRRDAAAQAKRVLVRTKDTLDLSGVSATVMPSDFHVTDAYFGDGYGQLNADARDDGARG